jgi:hypothetical protein
MLLSFFDDLLFAGESNFSLLRRVLS